MLSVLMEVLGAVVVVHSEAVVMVLITAELQVPVTIMVEAVAAEEVALVLVEVEHPVL